jgi:hypothetical protein
MMNKSRKGTIIESHTCTRIYPGETLYREKNPNKQSSFIANNVRSSTIIHHEKT